jgi:hypothetical protein
MNDDILSDIDEDLQQSNLLQFLGIDADPEDMSTYSKAALLSLDRMRTTEELVILSGLTEEMDSSIAANINNLPVVNDDEEHKAKYWHDLLSDKRESILKERQSQVLALKLQEEYTHPYADEVEIIDQSYFMRTFKAEKQEDQKLISDTIANFTLNEEQARAFSIVANHATLKHPEQLKMYLGGMAGTGKS